MKTYTETITIPKAEAKAHQDFLDKNIKQYQETDECERSEDTIATYSARFDERGVGFEVKVCGGQPPFVDGVIFEINEIPDDERNGLDANERWCEVCPIEPVEDNLLGEYIFEHDGAKFVVNVVEG